MVQSRVLRQETLAIPDTNQRNRDAVVRLARISRFVTHYIVLLTDKRKSRTRFPAQPRPWLFLGTNSDLHFDDLIWCGHRAVVILCAFLDLVHDIHAADDLADDCVLVI
jgi:hypothetical protein